MWTDMMEQEDEMSGSRGSIYLSSWLQSYRMEAEAVMDARLQ